MTKRDYYEVLGISKSASASTFATSFAKATKVKKATVDVRGTRVCLEVRHG